LPRAFVVRGRPREGIDRQRSRRLLHDKRNRNDSVTPATLEPAARRWLALDCDRLECPHWLDQFDEPDRTVEHVVSLLPVEIHYATVWWQFTSSAGIKPGISLRLFFWLERPLEDWQLKQWLADSPVDPAVFAPAQPIYVARPLFVGMTDPVPWRSGIWHGDRDEVTPPDIEKPQPRESQSAGVKFTESAGSGYEFHRSRIGDGPELGGFHIPVKSAVVAWIARQGAAVDTAWLREDLEKAIRETPSDPKKRDSQYIEFRVGDLDPLISAIRPRKRPRRPSTSGASLPIRHRWLRLPRRGRRSVRRWISSRRQHWPIRRR
jgi:hypothetical protein